MQFFIVSLLAVTVVAAPEHLQRLYATPGQERIPGQSEHSSSEVSDQFSLNTEGDTVAGSLGASQSEAVSRTGSLGADQGEAVFRAGSLAAGQREEFRETESSGARAEVLGRLQTPARVDSGRVSGNDLNLAPSTDGLFLQSNIGSGAPVDIFNPDGLEVANLQQPLVTAVTLTEESTIDFFTTLINVFYNTVPVTLTEFVKTTAVVPTFLVLTTQVDDVVFVKKAPITRTDTVTVTDLKTAYQYATEVSTDFYTVTHRAYDISQQVITSVVTETQILRPTIVSTVVLTERETSTVRQTVSHTVFISPETFDRTPQRSSTQQDLVLQQRNLFASAQSELGNLARRVNSPLSEQIVLRLRLLQQEFERQSINQPIGVQEITNNRLLRDQENIRSQITRALSEQRASAVINSGNRLQSSQGSFSYGY